MKVVKTSDLPKEPVSSPLFTGTQVFRQLIVDPAESKSFNFSIVNFSAGSRNKFHQHTSDQILIVTEGTGVVATDQRGAHRHRRRRHPDSSRREPLARRPGATPMSHITVQAKGGTTQQNEAVGLRRVGRTWLDRCALPPDRRVSVGGAGGASAAVPWNLGSAR